jgi:hypothetical protein
MAACIMPCAVATSSFGGEATEPQPLELLVRFENVTSVVRVPSVSVSVASLKSYLLDQCSFQTGWPVSRLQIVNLNVPFCEIRVVSSLCGGKGGFGTLLKGQSRQAGAKLTTDFGACRDLQGRRLRHVNDEIKLRKWRDMQKRQQNGEEVPDNELWNTPSGLYNWHLMTPTWADISKKATYRIQRQFQQLDKQAQKKQALQKEKEQVLQQSITHYVDQTALLGAEIQESLSDAIRQGLAASKKRKRPETAASVAVVAAMDPQQSSSSSLCTLSGEVVQDGSQFQSKSDFATVVLVLDKPMVKDSTTKGSHYYYEVTLVSGGVAQIGWASLIGGTHDFEPNNDFGDGVGDDAASYAVDVSRGLKFHAGKEQEYDCGIPCKAGDRLGCLLQEGTISYSLNGQDLGVAFEGIKVPSLFPALSCNQGEILELHTKSEDCKYIPDDAITVDAFIEEQEDISEKDAKESGESTKEVAEVIKKSAKSSAKLLEEKLKDLVKEPVKAEALDLESYQSAQELEVLGMDRLKGALMALQVKCGGSLSERAARLFSLKGLERRDYPSKVRAKGFVV